jgi:predicted MFS family arabinose efflux permease
MNWLVKTRPADPPTARRPRMLAGYLEILARRGARAFCSAGFVGRLPVAMTGIATVFLVHDVTGSYAIAGIMNAITICSAAAAGPVFGRLVDRHGQLRVLVPQIGLHATAIVGVVVVTVAHAPTAVLFAASVPAGAFTPAIGALVRARWSALLAGTAALDRAYALESVLDDVVFTIGPVIATALCVWRAAAGLVAAAGIEVCAGMVFALQTATAPPVHPAARKRMLSTLKAPGLRRLLATVFFVGVFLGTLNVSIVAFAQRHHTPTAAGWLLGGFAAASMIVGIAFGSRVWLRSPDSRLRIVLLYFAIAAVALPFAPSLPAMAAALIAAGCGLSPTLISCYTLADRLAPTGALAETLTWAVTALTGGSAAGAAMSGAIVNSHDAHLGLLVGTAAVVLAAAANLLWRAPAGDVPPRQLAPTHESHA